MLVVWITMSTLVVMHLLPLLHQAREARAQKNELQAKLDALKDTCEGESTLVYGVACVVTVWYGICPHTCHHHQLLAS